MQSKPHRVEFACLGSKEAVAWWAYPLLEAHPDICSMSEDDTKYSPAYSPLYQMQPGSSSQLAWKLCSSHGRGSKSS